MDRLLGTIQPYDWGDHTFLARLQGRDDPGGPEAELWYGAHPVAPSRLASHGGSLADAVTADPDSVLGPHVGRRFGRFPFLLKILAAAQPLSIQAHPSRERAIAGFAREERAGIPRNDPRRTYRDDNHKPELIVALTPFEAKCGFRDVAGTAALVSALAAAAGGGAEAAGLSELARRLDPGAGSAADDREILSGVLAWLFSLEAAPARSLVAAAVAAAGTLTAAGAATGFEPELAWTADLDRVHPGDIGVVVALLLNHVVLEPGQGVFLGAGNLHAYLRGAGVEIMANSDNVIRGGLTTKHVDPAELAEVVDTTPAPVPVQAAVGAVHRFDTPVPEFSLTRLAGTDAHHVEPEGPEILLVTEGTVHLRADRNGGPGPVVLGPGDAALAPFAGGPYRIVPDTPATLWRACVGAG